MSEKVLGWVGTVFGILGAVLLSLNISISGYGYVFFSISSVCLVVWSYMGKHGHQLLMQAVFTAINLLGCYRWLLS